MSEQARRPDPRITFAACVVIALGVWLRFWGMSTCELWADEAWWANKLVEGEVGWIRPPGYMWLTRQIIAVENTELTLRSLSMIAALLQLPLFFALMRRVVQPWIAVAATFVLAVQPAAVAFAKEFKPYALESCLHTGLLLLAVSYVLRPRTITLLGLVIVAAVAPPLSWSTVFVFPGLFLAVGLVALKSQRRADLALTVAGVVVTLAVLAVIFALRLRAANPHPEYWGKAYGVFYVGDSVTEHIAWYLRHTAELLAFPGRLRLWWGALPKFEPTSMVLGILGLGVLLAAVRKGRPASLWALLFVLPWGVFLGFNLAGQWPWGVFRTNVFMLGYALALAAFGLDAVYAIARRRGGRAGGVVVVIVTTLLLAQALPVQPDQFQCKGAGTMALNASVWRALRLLQGTIGRPDHKVTIAVDGQACSALTYYRQYHAVARDELAAFLQPPVEVRCSTGRDPGWEKLLEEVMAGPDSFWVIVGKRHTSRMVEARLPHGCTHSLKRKLRGTWVYWCGRSDDPVPVFSGTPPPPLSTTTEPADADAAPLKD